MSQVQVTSLKLFSVYITDHEMQPLLTGTQEWENVEFYTTLFSNPSIEPQYI